MTEQTISINSEQSEHESIDALVERANRALQETGINITVAKTDVYKNNGAIQGLTLRDEDHNCCPTVYNIEELASMSDSDLAAHIENMFNRTAMNIPIDEQLMDRDYILNNVRARVWSDSNLPGIEANDIAYVPEPSGLDLVTTFIVPVKDFNDGTASYTLKFKHLQTLDLGIHEVFEAAKRHIDEDEIYLKSMYETLKDMMGENVPIPEDAPDCMWVLTNSTKLYGAALLLSETVLENASKTLGSDYLIVGSSVHELLLIRKDESSGMAPDSIRQIIADVNDTQVDPVDILSYSLYQYSPEDGLQIAA